MPADLLLPRPTPAAVRASRTVAGLSQDGAARLMGYVDRKSWWRFETDGPQAREIDPATWALWLLATDQHPRYKAMPAKVRRTEDVC